MDSSPAVSSDGMVVYVGSNNNNAYAINAVNGSKIWNFSTGGAVYTSPALSNDGMVVYVGSDDFNIYTLVDNCYQATCSLHGTCINSLKGHTCDCAPGFMGTHCGAVDYCYHERCSSHGSCHNTLNVPVNDVGPYQTTAQSSFSTPNTAGYTCDCDAGYTGDNCENTYCTGQSCSGHGTCVNSNASFTCKCAFGFVGKDCEMTYCTGQACSEHGTCVNGNASFTCKCTFGFVGKDCGIVDYCTAIFNHGINITCSEHGSCVNGKIGYTCSCTQGYFGKTCSWHVLPPYAYGVVGGILVAVVGCWVSFCRRKPSDTYDMMYSQIQEDQDLNHPHASIGTVGQCRQCTTKASGESNENFCRSCGARKR